MSRRDKIQMWVTAAIAVPIFYLAIAASVFRFRHPELTQTQCFLHLWDAACWRTLEGHE